MLFHSVCYLSMVFDPFSFLGFFGPYWENEGYVAINSQLPCIYGEGIMMFWTNFGGINCECQNRGNKGGIMMYNYGLDHIDLCGQFFVLTYSPLMCENRSSSYG